MQRIPYSDLVKVLAGALRKLGFTPERAQLSARLFAETTRDGVYSHGVNRFLRYIRMIRNGRIDVHASPVCVTRMGALERWDGRRGPGNLNAYAAMERAIALAREHGVGCLALANTNHWMRGGTYGWQAADAGLAAICWTNTMPNLPPWGSSAALIGNNPLVFAVPRSGGHVVLDMAMSQFSFGALAGYRSRGQKLPVDGGFDKDGNLTRDPAAIESSNRALPIGYWKGSGLSILLDTMAAVLAAGQATHQIAPDPEQESGVSQVFLAFDVARLGAGQADEIADGVVASLHAAGDASVRYPGEQTFKIRKENAERGIPVDDAVWREIQNL